MYARIGCEFVYQSSDYTPMLFMVRPRDRDLHRLIRGSRTTTPDIPVHEFIDEFGNHVWRLTAPPGELCLQYDALAAIAPVPDPQYPDLRGTPVEKLPDDTLIYTLPSRYCPSDLMLDAAWNLFGSTRDGWSRVQAICDWLHSNITYGSGSTSTTTALEAFEQRRGVCRDFAHMGISFCRALNVPARYVCGYLPDIGVPPDPNPMDFHAWFEAWIGGAWRTFDARHNIPRTGRMVIARGRDAVDTALTTIYGSSKLIRMRVWADEVNNGVPLDQTPAEQKVGL